MWTVLIPVLILILLEYGLRPVTGTKGRDVLTSLNPYSTGIWSATPQNPTGEFWLVLILILLEYGLRPGS